MKAPPPDKVAPQLATLTKAAPDGGEWLHEIKFDGYRMLAHIADGGARLLNRNGLSWSVKLPDLAEVLPDLPVSEAVLDGEVCHVLPNGVTSFGALQADISDRTTEHLVYFLFDIIYLDGWRLDRCALIDRKKLLERILSRPHDRRLQFSEHHAGQGPAFFAAAKKTPGIEGIVSKRADPFYVPGRNAGWLKVKALGREELIILGYTDPGGSRVGFGGLVLGYRAGAPGGPLTYAGTVGTGFSDKLLRALYSRMQVMEQSEPNARLPKGYPHGNVHWVRPELVGEVAFTEWTRDGVLRHPTFLGLREDKPASDVVLERGCQGHALDKIEAHLMALPDTPLTRSFVFSVEVLLHIARQEGRPCGAAELLRRVGAAKRYLEPMLQCMAKSGILHSLRGPAGGYKLGRDPSQINLAEVFAVMLSKKEGLKRAGATVSVAAVTTECLDGLASKWKRDLEAITVQNLLDRVPEKELVSAVEQK